MASNEPNKEGDILQLRDAIRIAKDEAITDFKAALKEEIKKEIKGIDEHQGYSQGYINGMKNVFRLVDQVKPINL